VERFAALVDALIYTRSRNGKLKLIADYLCETPDPDRGWALAALTDGLDFPAVKASTIRNLLMERVDPVLFQLSRDYVGDTAETASLLWPENDAAKHPLTVAEAVDALLRMTRLSALRDLGSLLDRLDAAGRFALLKLATGAMRIGISARLAKVAFAQAFEVSVDDVEEYWHGQTAPYHALFDWAANGAAPPNARDLPLFRPFMLAHPLEETEVDMTTYAAEWKWDGIRVQIVHVANELGGETRLYSRSGDDISGTFPEIVEAMHLPSVLDGELLVRGSHQGGQREDGQGGAASFNALQQRLGRKTVSKAMLTDYPAFVRLYDILIDGEEDLRALSWEQRRLKLEAFVPRLEPERFDLSQVIPASSLEELAAIRERARDDAIEGVMLKRRDSPYVPGRRTGLWYKWKRDPLLIDCVLMYAQRGSGKRSSFYSDYTFGCWDGDPDQGAELLPVGKAYFGFTDEELKWLDSYVRRHTVNRFGPVRETDKSLVLEVAFDSVHESKRHKSGVAMRFPRISRIRTDKPAHEADRLAALRALIRD
jgi:DNA ligase-1